MLRMGGSLKFGEATASLIGGKWSAASRRNTLAADLHPPICLNARHRQVAGGALQETRYATIKRQYLTALRPVVTWWACTAGRWLLVDPAVQDAAGRLGLCCRR